MTRVLIVGGGFAGLNAAKMLGGARDVEVTLIDRHNHHLFQPLLYQVAMAGLSPADIAAPIRSILSRYANVHVLLGNVELVDLQRKVAVLDTGEIAFDYLILASGASHSYFGHEEWEPDAPGLKTLEQATEIRRRVLTAFEKAERATDSEERRKYLTFVIVGGGPTGVELAGAIGEMSRHTLAKDFQVIDSRSAKVILVEAGPRILPMFTEQSAARAARDLKTLGVEIRTNRSVTAIDRDGVQAGEERIAASTVLWAAGVRASPLGRRTGLEVDGQGRVIVEPDLSVKGHPHVFVAGDLARYSQQSGKPLPGTAPVAMQQGGYIGRTILADLRGHTRTPFQFIDKGQMATIGRNRAVIEIGRIRMGGFAAWISWLAVHIYYLTGFEHRLLVVLQWAWSYLTFGRGARLIVGKEWQSGKSD
ncbi:MAG TPA: NAD(P)/FAD-dependent oxidoreductase [Terriglobia bacterium]|nr:NAD(P)/FAD-dependent oxidoreductase [Terriglobia bacterium]